MTENIIWLGHASFKIINEKVVYIDPWKIKEKERGLAELILITHEHYDHCSPEDIAKLCKSDTQVVAPKDCVSKISGQTMAIKPGDILTIKGITVEAVPAYNLKKPYHPKANGWVGYIITIGKERIYHAGDTDLIPEMERIKADIALLPCGGTYTMDADQAAQAANKIKPKLAIPMHYGSIIGTEKDVQRFKENVRGVEVQVLKQL
jgi:L-ascorbate metabolism protein UlaG (beta-lactamase superfamily)